MKKLLLTAVILGGLGTSAFAMAVTNPMYMPEKGQIMSDTLAYYTNTTDGKSDKHYGIRETISYNLTDRFQLGGYLGYQKIDKLNEKDFTNPGVFAVFRLWKTILDLDIGGRIEFDAFDDIKHGGVADGTDKYGLFVRAGADLGIFYLGAIGGVDHWDGLGARTVSLGQDKKVYNTDIKVFAIFDILDILGAGGEAGYKTFDTGGANYYKGYYLTGRLDINPLPSRLGATAFVTYENIDHTDENYILGLNLKVVI